MIFKCFAVFLVLTILSEGKTFKRRTTIDLKSRAKRDVDGLRINSFVINCTEILRFAKVDISSSVTNVANADKEFNFMIRIPKSAFISEFVLKFGDKETRAIVAEKDAAKEVYENAKEQNITSGHVTQQTTIADDKDRDIFDISVNIRKQATVEFRLQYNEFLERHAGVYSQTFYIMPKDIANKLQIVGDYTERQNFTNFGYKAPFADGNFVKVQQRASADGYYGRKVEWVPDLATAEIDDKEGNEFEVNYELEPLSNGGHVIINDEGDFAHYFSSVCNSTQILPKKVVFVIDISGSMKGMAIQQVRIAIGAILDQLRFTDYFNLILFEAKVYVYRSEFVAATEANIAQAKAFVRARVVASGSTNMNDALLAAASRLNEDDQSSNDNFVKTIVFLTDGEPTYGVTNKDRIRNNLRNANYIGGECCKSSLFTIALSKSPDIEFLRQLTNDHLGRLRVIRESLGEEIGQELVDLYAEIHNPYYRNVRFSFYSDGQEVAEEDISQSYFLQYDCGAEIVVGGHAKPGAQLEPQVRAEGTNDQVVFNTIPTLPSRKINSEMLSRLVAYKQVKELLKLAQTTTNTTTQRSLKARALELSLKMEFVTSVTSLVVTLFPPPRKETNNFPLSKGGSMTRSSGAGNFEFPDFYGFDDTEQLYEYSDLNLGAFPNSAVTVYAAKCIVHILFIVTQILIL